MKKQFFIYIFISVLFYAFSLEYPDGENSKSWHLLEMGKLAYERGELGEAMLYAGRSYDIHKKHYSEMYEYLYEALKSKQVKYVGDRISNVYNVLLTREDKPAYEFLDEIFLIHPPEFFDRSIKNLMLWLKERKDAYPEVHYLKASVFKAEGEFGQAMIYYNNAWKERKFLDMPDSKFDIIYSMADVSERMQKYDEREKYLLLILTEDSLFGTTGMKSRTLDGMLKSLRQNENTEKFFLMYRHDMGTCLKAYKDLTDIYLESQSYERALHTATISATIAVTLLEKTIKKNYFLYKYTDMPQLMKDAGRKNEVSKWADSLHVWEILLRFADVLRLNNYTLQAQYFYLQLAKYCPSFEIARSAYYNLEKMYVKIVDIENE